LSGIGSQLIPVETFDVVEYWRVVAARWWLVSVGVLLGAALGFGLLHGRANTYRASAQLYVGQGGPSDDLPTTLAEASAYVTSVAATRAAARATGFDPVALRQSVSTALDVGPGASRLGSAGSALIEISVTGSNAHKVAQAADVLARNTAVVLSTYSRRELRLSSANLAVVSAELRNIRARLKVDQSALQQLASDPRSTTTQRLVEINAFAGQVAEDSKQRTLLQQETLAARLQMAFEQDVQLPRLARPAESVPRGGPSRAVGVLVGALIGLLLSVLAALAVAASRPPPAEPSHA
jgi:capsular polysaccharide biosynthesis protein